ncbi:hypothetical protein CW304_22150 [Bacillus sp. UFRGS-B20]|nr:hypothetical protein CW304_22150 [Bacillus sp. UFRGS-B20]
MLFICASIDVEKFTHWCSISRTLKLIFCLFSNWDLNILFTCSFVPFTTAEANISSSNIKSKLIFTKSHIIHHSCVHLHNLGTSIRRITLLHHAHTFCILHSSYFCNFRKQITFS